MALCTPGDHESLKGAVHGGMAAGALICLVYNVWSYGKRRESHLLVNSVLYAGLFTWEWARVQQHLESR